MSRARDFADLAGSADAGGLTGRNLIINGAMNVAQRGTSSTGQTTGGYKTVDRFRTDQNGMTGSYTQATDVPSGYGFSNSYKIEVTTAAGSDAGTLRLDTRIEAQDLRNSGWDYTSSSSFVTFSCWVKSSLAGTYYFGFRTDDGTSRQYTEAFTLVADTWKKLEINIPGDSSVTFNDDNGMGALIALHIDERTAQSDSGHTLDGWQNYSASSRTPDFSQNWSETLNATFHTTGWQLEVGEQATPFEHRSYADELFACSRYYTNLAQFNADNFGSFHNATEAKVALKYPRVMRAAPSVTTNSPFTNLVEESGVAVETPATVSVNYTRQSGCVVAMTGLTGTSGNGIFIRQATNDTTIEADAEL